MFDDLWVFEGISEVNTGSQARRSTSFLCQLGNQVSVTAYMQEVCKIWQSLTGSVTAFLLLATSALVLIETDQVVQLNKE